MRLDGLTRCGVNRNTCLTRQVFKWAVSLEMVPASVIEGLKTVPGLERGRSDARETEEVLVRLAGEPARQ